MLGAWSWSKTIELNSDLKLLFAACTQNVFNISFLSLESRKKWVFFSRLSEHCSAISYESYLGFSWCLSRSFSTLFYPRYWQHHFPPLYMEWGPTVCWEGGGPCYIHQLCTIKLLRNQFWLLHALLEGIGSVLSLSKKAWQHRAAIAHMKNSSRDNLTRNALRKTLRSLSGKEDSRSMVSFLLFFSWKHNRKLKDSEEMLTDRN